MDQKIHLNELFILKHLNIPMTNPVQLRHSIITDGIGSRCQLKGQL